MTSERASELSSSLENKFSVYAVEEDGERGRVERGRVGRRLVGRRLVEKGRVGRGDVWKGGWWAEWVPMERIQGRPEG